MRFHILLTAGAAVALVPAAAQAVPTFALLNNQPGVGQTLVTFDTDTRAVTSSVLLQTANTLSPLSSIDVRPSTGELYGYRSSDRQLFIIDPSNGALNPVGDPLPASVNGSQIDFNPVPDLVRLVGTTTNFRVNPDSGALVAQDGDLVFAPGDINAGRTPDIRAIAYTNSFPGATSTTMYDIDASAQTLVIQNPPNAGTLTTVGLLGPAVNLQSGLFGNFIGFDISPTNTAFLTNSSFNNPTNLFTVDLATGIATDLGQITGLPTGRSVQAIAVVPEPAAAGLAVAAGMLVLRRRRA